MQFSHFLSYRYIKINEIKKFDDFPTKRNQRFTLYMQSSILIIEPKCYCSHDLWNQRIGHSQIENGTEAEIICQINGKWQKDGSCGSDEYCAGPNTIEDAICGQSNLCTRKGKNC